MPKAAEPVKPSPKAPARMSKKDPLTREQVKTIDAYWRAANYLSACQLYLLDNPLLREPLKEEHLKRTIVGHWGTCPGQNFIYTHLNRAIVKYDLDMIYLSGPGHGGNAVVAQDYLDGSYSEVYPNISQDAAGMKRLFRQFSFPGGIPSQTAPNTPGSINEGGELGYSLAHAFGAVMDNPGLIAACVVGDGEAETAPLTAAWHSNKFLNPITDGAVLPILHLNGFKLSNPTLFSRISHEETEMFFKGCGWEPRFVEGDAIGLFAVIRSDAETQAYRAASGNYIQNAKFVRQADGSWREEGSKSYYMEQGQVMDLYAYYPYAENADPTALVYDASVAEADFMTARTPGFSERDGEIRLVFRHKLALAEAFVADADKLADYAVTVQDVRTKAVFSLAAAAQDA